MLYSISDFFNRKVYSKHFLDLFEEMSKTITKEYIQDIFDFIELNGNPPSFEEMMKRIRALSNELVMRAEWMREDYKEGKGYRSAKLTTGCKRIIRNAVAEYMRETKSISSIQQQKLHEFDIA